MNESIGSKGTGRDFRRTIIIKKRQKEKLKKYKEQEELKKLEKEVKKKQIFTLIKTIPLVITYEAIKDVLPNKDKKELLPKKEELLLDKEEKDLFIEEIKKEPIKEAYKEIVIVLKDGTTKKIKVAKEFNLKQTEELKEIKEETLPKIEILEEEKEKIEEQKKEPKKEIIENSTEEYQVSNIKTEEFSELSEHQQEKLTKLKSRKIIDVYEKDLKDIRYDLRQLIFEYNVLVDESNEIIESKEAEEILDKLNTIIERMEKLKSRINIENLDKYDDNYIYTLIEDYIDEFKDKKVIKEIKDSKLYILISEKLNELDKEKEKLKKDVETKKDKLEVQEEKLDNLKEKYYKLDKVNKDLADFQYQQNMMLQEIKRKIDEATTVRERTEVKIEGMNRQTRRMLRRLTLAMMFPGVRTAAAITATTTAYLNFMKNVINPKTVTKKYKVITVKDYSSSIESSIKEINSATSLLNKTEKQIDKMISEIKNEFSEYIGVIKECDELLGNLEKVKSGLHEKEYELQRIKEQEEKELERNNAKVLKMGEYPM